MESSQNAQQLVYRFQYLKDQRDMFAGQLDLLNASLGNILNTKQTLENLKNVKENQEILVPIGGLANVRASIKDPQKVILYVNQDVAIEKNLDQSLEFIEKVIEQHNEQINFIRTQIQNMDSNLMSMSQELQKNIPK
ncbi:MAG: prefoldin subunit alpha [Promethearchaeota archaeon]|nr:MAG: prefoldin subunit alpha [Candidatus Lokiarchaeota archaeon]